MVMDCLLLVRCCIKHASMTCRSSQKSPVLDDSSRSLRARCAAQTFQLSRMSPCRACLLLLFELTPSLFSRWLFRDADAFFFFFCQLLLENARSEWNLWPRFKKKKNWQAKEKYVSSFQPCKLIQPAFVKTSLLIIKISLYFWRTGRHLVSKYFLLYNSKLIFQLTNHRLFLGGAVSLLGAYSSSSLAPPVKLPLLRHFFPP